MYVIAHSAPVISAGRDHLHRLQGQRMDNVTATPLRECGSGSFAAQSIAAQVSGTCSDLDRSRLFDLMDDDVVIGAICERRVRKVAPLASAPTAIRTSIRNEPASDSLPEAQSDSSLS